MPRRRIVEGSSNRIQTPGPIRAAERSQMSIVEAITDQEERETTSAWRRYVEMLLAGKTDQASVAKLRDVASTLGFDSSAIAQHVVTIRRVKQLRQAIRDGKGLDAKRATAQKAVADSV